MIRFDLLLRRDPTDFCKALHIAGLVHLAHLRELVRREFDFERGAQPSLFEQHVVAGVGRKVWPFWLSSFMSPTALSICHGVRQSVSH